LLESLSDEEHNVCDVMVHHHYISYFIEHCHNITHTNSQRWTAAVAIMTLWVLRYVPQDGWAAGMSIVSAIYHDDREAANIIFLTLDKRDEKRS